MRAISWGVACSALYAELLAVREACLFALEGGFRNSVVETDCADVVKHVKGEISANSLDHTLVKDIQNLCGLCGILDILFIGRNGNGVAHSLAVKSHDFPVFSVWLEDLPEWLISSLKCFSFVISLSF